jgi:hypothetical protein
MCEAYVKIYKELREDNIQVSQLIEQTLEGSGENECLIKLGSGVFEKCFE